MKPLSSILTYGLYQSGAGEKPARRAEAIEPLDNGLFILPMQQAFVKNRRIMASTMRLVGMLAGWAGKGGPIETTQIILSKHIGYSVRQIRRMLKDAQEEGYLRYHPVTNRMGYICGIKIYLNLKKILKQKAPEGRRNQDRTFKAATNRNLFNNYRKDDVLEKKLASLAHSMGEHYALE